MSEAQKNLFGAPLGRPEGLARPASFGGVTYEPRFDEVRLTGQLKAVYDLMRDGRWRTLGEIRDAIGKGTESAVSARLRDLRKDEFGAHDVQRRHRGERQAGHFEYRLVPA